jgi:hypothetical protein
MRIHSVQATSAWSWGNERADTVHGVPSSGHRLYVAPAWHYAALYSTMERAFAMTAHKAQGKTMDAILIDLESTRGTESPYVRCLPWHDPRVSAHYPSGYYLQPRRYGGNAVSFTL